jgi:predicted ATP-binding protein involved in virulence
MNNKAIRLTESDLRKIISESINKLIYEAYNDMNFDDGYTEKHTHPERRETAEDYLKDELSAVGARGTDYSGGADEDIAVSQRDLWVNFNKLISNITYLYNKTRDDNYAKLCNAVADTLELIPFDTSDFERQFENNKYQVSNYIPGEGERTYIKYKGQDDFKRKREEEYKRQLKDYCEKNGVDYEEQLKRLNKFITI